MGYPVAYRRGAGGSMPLPGGFRPRQSARPPRPANDNFPKPANDNSPPTPPGAPSAPFTERFTPADLFEWTPPGKALRLLRLLDQAGQLYYGLQPNIRASVLEVPAGWTHICGPVPVASGYIGGVVTASPNAPYNGCGLSGQVGPRYPSANPSTDPPSTWRSITRQAWQWRSYGTYYQWIEVWGRPDGYSGPDPRIGRPTWPADQKKLMPTAPELVPPRSPHSRPIQAPRTTPPPLDLPWWKIPGLNDPDIWWRDAGNYPPGDPLPQHPTPKPKPQPRPVPRPEPAPRPDQGLSPENEPEWFVRPGQRLEVRPHGRLAPSAASPTRKPPGPRVKERKFSGRGMLPMALQTGLKVADAIGEGLDLIDAIHDALPRKYQAKGEGKRDNWFPGRVPGQGMWKATGATPLDKLDALYRHLDKVDWMKAAKNMAVNEMIDRIGGRIGRASGEAARRSGGRSAMLGPLH